MTTNNTQHFYHDKTIVIIGAGGGIGRIFVQQCLAYTNRVVLLGRNIDTLTTVSKAIPVSQCFCLDMSDLAAIKDTIDKIEDTIGPINISFNLSGYDVFRQIQDITLEEIIKTSRINFEGPLFYTQHLLSKMLVRQSGIIANVNAFSNGHVPFPFYTIDSASRAGIASYYRALRKEITNVYPQIRFVNFSPPITDTKAERARITSQIWTMLNMKFHDPEQVVSRILREIARGKDEVMTFDEWALFWIETISQKMSNIVFFNQFRKISRHVLNGTGDS